MTRAQLQDSLAIWQERETRYRKNWRSKKAADPRRAYWYGKLKAAKTMVAKRTSDLAKLSPVRVDSVSTPGVNLIKQFEGFVGHPYKDAVGVWTIGYGHTKGVGPTTKPITQAQAAELLRQDLNRKYAPPVTALNLPLTQNQFDALVSFVYNVGPGGVAANTGVGRSLRARDWKAAADHLLDWDKAGGRTLPGLTARRRAERALFLTR